MARGASKSVSPTARRMLTRREAAEYLGVSPATMSRWAAERGGPSFVKLSDSDNGTVRYPSDALDDFLAARTKHPKGGGE
jgi:predicted DNA-binding transcriptional regulator AlpA